MNIEHILNEVERERRKVLVLKLKKMHPAKRIFVPAVSGGDEYYFLLDLAESDPLEFIEICESFVKGYYGDDRSNFIRNLDYPHEAEGDIGSEQLLSQELNVQRRFRRRKDIKDASSVAGALCTVINSSFPEYQNLVINNKYRDKIFNIFKIMAAASFWDNHTPRFAHSLNGIMKYDKNAFIEIYEELISKSSSCCYLTSASEVLEILTKLLHEIIKIDSKKYFEVFYHFSKLQDLFDILSDTAEYNVACSLEYLADVDPDKFMELCEERMNSKRVATREGIAYCLPRMASINSAKFISFVESILKQVDEESTKIKSITIYGALQEVSRLAPETFTELCVDCLHDMSSKEVRLAAASQLSILTKVDPAEFYKQYTMELSNFLPDIRYAVAASLAGLASSDEELFVQLCDKARKSDDSTVRAGNITAFCELAKINPEKTIDAYIKASQDKKPEVRISVASHLNPLSEISPDTYFDIFHKLLNDLNRDVRETVREHCLNHAVEINPGHMVQYIDTVPGIITALEKTLEKEKITPIQDAEYTFITKYLHSKYAYQKNNVKSNPRSEKQILSELKKLVQNPDKNYARMSEILEQGHAKSLDEIVDWSSLVSPYVILKYLGGGASGSVFLVFDPYMNSKYALKLIDTEKMSLSEAWLMASFEQDPKRPASLPKIHAAGKHLARYGTKETFAIVMEYVEGVNANRKFSDSQVLRYSTQLFKAVKYLHERGIFHRDIRPENIIVTSYNTIKLLDFGIATDVPGADPKDNRRFGGENDFISLGQVIYKMATGRNLFNTTGIKTSKVASEVRDYRTWVYEEGSRLQNMLDKIEKYLNNKDIKTIVKMCLSGDIPKIYAAFDKLDGPAEP